MTADEVIALRALWDKYNFRSYLPEATVLATRDWLTYVQMMAAEIPRDEGMINYPSEAEVAWSWPEGVAIVMEEPVAINHTIISKTRIDAQVETVPAHVEVQACAGMVFGIGQEIPSRVLAGVDDLLLGGPLFSIPVLWIGTDPSDIITGNWLPGGVAMTSTIGRISESTCFMLALIHALGHRLTAVGEPLYANRGERRRTQRALPSLRVLRLGSGASVRPQEAPGSIEWSHRWLVRGHWRHQPYGPRNALRRMKWIDPFVKGPPDKPFDERRTVWRTP